MRIKEVVVSRGPMSDKYYMRDIRQAMAVGLIIGSALTGIGITVDHVIEYTAEKPAPQEAPLANSEFFRMAKQLVDGVYCDPDNNEVYGLIDNKIAQEPDSSCNSNSANSSATVSNN